MKSDEESSVKASQGYTRLEWWRRRQRDGSLGNQLQVPGSEGNKARYEVWEEEKEVGYEVWENTTVQEAHYTRGMKSGK